jgi:hypothetical protein
MMDEEYEDSDVNKLINFLTNEGAIEVVGVDETGDFIYNLTFKCKELFPEFFEEHFSHVNTLAFSLWQKGIIEMKFDEDKGPMVMMKSVEYTQSMLNKVEPDEKVFLENMLRNYHQNNNKWYN